MYFESFKLQKCFSDTRWRHVLADEKKKKKMETSHVSSTVSAEKLESSVYCCVWAKWILKTKSVKETAAQKRKRFRKRREKEFSVYNTKVETHSS